MHELGLILEDGALQKFAQHPVQGGGFHLADFVHDLGRILLVLGSAHVGGGSGVGLHRPIS